MGRTGRRGPRRGPRRERRNIPRGQAHIQATFNNTIITITDPQGNTVAWASGGTAGFKGSRKSTPYAAQLAAQQAARLAQDNGIPHAVDVYPMYGSDAEAYWRAGGSARIALIGPGVDASHNYERTHMDALVASVELITAYLRS